MGQACFRFYEVKRGGFKNARIERSIHFENLKNTAREVSMTSDELKKRGTSAVKSLGRDRIAGRVITFSSHADPDLVGEYFDHMTDFWMTGQGDRKPILYRHAIDSKLKRRRFGEALLSRVELSLCPHDSVCEPRNILTLKSFANYDTPEFDELFIPGQRDYEAEALRLRVELAVMNFERIIAMPL